jgi:enamine deaminase RidA (YjgF/YER057c/UK114 family)
MEKREINPFNWLEAFNLNQAIEVSGAQRILVASGQTSDDNGTPMHPGDLVAQFKQAWSNLTAVLSAAGMTPANIVRLNFYTVDVGKFMEAAGELVPVFAGAGCKPVGTLLGVTRLWHPDVMLEIEATAIA